MQRKRLDRDIWTTITSKRYVQKYIHSEGFRGIVSILYIDEVSKASIWDYPDAKIPVCDSGMKWLQILPDDENYLITAMCSPEDHINIWYIDMIAGKGFASDHVAVFDDLYLDLIVRPNGDIKVDDMDELVDALAQKDITEELYKLALATKEKLEKHVLNDIPNLHGFCMKLLREIQTQ